MSSVVYKAIITTAEKFVPQSLQPLWQHPAGPKTVFFWAPVFKWVTAVSAPMKSLLGLMFNFQFLFIYPKGLVIAGIGDLQRPAEKLSVAQSSALAATGLIWSRYSLVIIPKNWSLFSVNVFVALTSLYQIGRAIRRILPPSTNPDSLLKHYNLYAL